MRVDGIICTCGPRASSRPARRSRPGSTGGPRTWAAVVGTAYGLGPLLRGGRVRTRTSPGPGARCLGVELSRRRLPVAQVQPPPAFRVDGVRLLAGDATAYDLASRRPRPGRGQPTAARHRPGAQRLARGVGGAACPLLQLQRGDAGRRPGRDAVAAAGARAVLDMFPNTGHYEVLVLLARVTDKAAGRRGGDAGRGWPTCGPTTTASSRHRRTPTPTTSTTPRVRPSPSSARRSARWCARPRSIWAKSTRRCMRLTDVLDVTA